MAVLMRAQAPGLTKEAYEAVAGEAFMKALRNFGGFVGLHAAGPTADGWQVFEIWESAARHQAWIEQVIAPQMPPGADDSMSVEYFDLHTAIL